MQSLDPTKDLLKTYNTPPTDVHTIILMCKKIKARIGPRKTPIRPTARLKEM